MTVGELGVQVLLMDSERCCVTMARASKLQIVRHYLILSHNVSKTGGFDSLKNEVAIPYGSCHGQLYLNGRYCTFVGR